MEKENKTVYVTYETNPIEVNNSNIIYEQLIRTPNNKHVVVKKKFFDVKFRY